MISKPVRCLQIAANVWFCYNAIHLMWRYWDDENFANLCNQSTTELPDLSGPGDTERLVFAAVFYFHVRLIDLLDTVFFVLTKKFSHVSFLHVYHHCIVLLNAYVYMRSGWGHLIFSGAVMNSMVHVLMYSYYFLATFSSMKPYLWWKRYLTLTQILQFVTMALHVLWVTTRKGCRSNPLLVYYNIIQLLVFIALFSRFYIQSYAAQTHLKLENDTKSLKQN
ncbi:elongation of very long chain fatty acids protein 4-like [Tropilaelaps mercedesae]|uniref:Elongation of very long chain fatty acids protein n=1 Tax=Tropilaelaps mercedesae TaxID=418985 RepID=A0A1V9XQN3_9ACAR|nr:elongation of very long chain fatty acids protein 4-like [Tropilaelaps mercedesae]